MQNIIEGHDEDFMEEVIFTDLLEVKAAEYEDDQEQMKKQEANIFVPSSSPGNIIFQYDIQLFMNLYYGIIASVDK